MTPDQYLYLAAQSGIACGFVISLALMLSLH